MNCEQCGKPCQLLMPKTNPEASEWYCGDCHKSYAVANALIASAGKGGR